MQKKSGAQLSHSLGESYQPQSIKMCILEGMRERERGGERKTREEEQRGKGEHDSREQGGEERNKNFSDQLRGAYYRRWNWTLVFSHLIDDSESRLDKRL